MKLAELFEKVEVTDRNAIYDIKDLTDGSVEQLAEIIKHNCKVMLAAYKKSGGVIFRGVRPDSEGKVNGAFSLITGIRKDRKPVCLSDKFHEQLHMKFLQMGLDVTRKNSIFCTTDERTAMVWGDLFIIFVKDGWKGLVFENKVKGYAFDELCKYDYEYESVDAKIEMTLKELKPKLFSSSTDLASVISKGYEDILISGDSYIAVKVDGHYAKFDKLMKLIGLSDHEE